MPLSVIGIIVYVVVLIIAWFFRDTLFGSLSASIPVLLGITAGIIFYIASLPLIESLRGGELRRAWRQRLEERDGLARPKAWWQSPSSLIQRINSTLNNGFKRKTV